MSILILESGSSTEGACVKGRAGALRGIEVRILTKNRKERWLDITATTIDFDGGRARLVSAFDLTERK